MYDAVCGFKKFTESVCRVSNHKVKFRKRSTSLFAFGEKIFLNGESARTEFSGLTKCTKRAETDKTDKIDKTDKFDKFGKYGKTDKFGKYDKYGKTDKA